jgi:hypothetical protein
MSTLNPRNKQSPGHSGRPPVVGHAVKLLYATLGIGVLQAALEFPALARQLPVVFILFVWAVVFGLSGYLIHEIGARQNWARIVCLSVLIFGFPFSILPILYALSTAPVYGLIGMVQMLGLIVALVMLFQRASNEWFRQSKAGRTGTDHG